ncbi:hypothetical protein HZP39_04045 [Elizabethkingia anophelis]|nr:hypothetical protein [Elizabethkingia anophelis]MCT4239396.1 hypothetical protein [Elizabethkingia anophelis]MCT4282033.1 hypothetical protein [Elizabethkingia anophelis]MCT4292618.1 hypothetical protein [Elizabethkingia anophelis]
MTNLDKKQQVKELILKNQFEDMDLNEEGFYIELFFDEDGAQWCIQRNTNGNLIITADSDYQFKLNDKLSDLVEEFVSEETKDQRESEPEYHWFMRNNFKSA